MNDVKIAELASRSGVPATTLRYYEKVGLLPADRTPSGYRIYDERAIERLRFISAAKRLDLSLDSIRGLLRAWQDEPCRAVKAQLIPMVATRLTETTEGIAALTELARSLQAGLQRLEALPDRDHACDPTCAFLDDPAAAAESDLDARTQLSETKDPDTQDSEPALVACSLSGRDQHDRLTQWHELLNAAQIQHTPDGATAEIPVTRVAELTALIIAEQECCPFIRFELSFRGTLTRLTITTEDPVLVAELLPETARR